MKGSFPICYGLIYVLFRNLLKSILTREMKSENSLLILKQCMLLYVKYWKVKINYLQN